MSEESNLHICHLMILYLEDMKWIKALVKKLWVFRNENCTKFFSRSFKQTLTQNHSETFHFQI